MTALRQPRALLFEEYLLLERGAKWKNEYLDGFIYAMSGGSPNHAFISVNAGSALSSRLRGSGYRVASSDLMVATEDRLFSAYPDITVVCGALSLMDGHENVLMNPRVIVEVLSPSTEAYDQGEKFERYKRIASLQGYLLISQDEPRAELRHREGEEWVPFVAVGLDASLPLPSLGVSLPLAEIYEGVEWSAPPTV